MNPRSYKTVFLLGLLSPVGPVGAFAQRPGGPPRLVLQALDTDRDGKLSAAEIEAAPRSLLTLDRNGDGRLTADEIQPRPENAGASADELVKQMMSFDKNGDGVLTPDEVPARMTSMFQRGDADHDGKLTAGEIRAMANRQGMPAGAPAGTGNLATRMDPLLNALDNDQDGTISAAEIAAAGKSLLTLDRNGDGEIAPDEMRMRQQTPQERVDHMLDEWDTNKDGKIAKAEAPDRMQQQFEAIDKNGDGFLDREELTQYFGAMDAGPTQSCAQTGTKNQGAYVVDKMTWKLLRRAAACMPLGLAATQQTAIGQAHVVPADRQAGTWTFHHEHVLGTSLELRVRARSLAEAQRPKAATLAEIDRCDSILSAWRPTSEFSRWAATRMQPVVVSPELFAVLAGFEHWRGRTDGALDASAEAAARLWRKAASEQRSPSAGEIAQTIEAMNQPHWRLDAAHGTATRLTDVPLALASFAKSHVSAQAAEAALGAGATGVMINLGGDVVVRGSLRQTVELADPRSSAENDLPLDRIQVADRAVATSGSYRRGVDLSADTALRAPLFSHIVDPRTARPTGHILSSTVIAQDAATAGALATAFSVLTPEQSVQLADRTPGVDYLLVARDGRQIVSPGWSRYQLPALRPVVHVPASRAVIAADTGTWNQAFELALGLELPRIDDARYRRPYVAVWIEDADHFPVRTLALWTQKPRWLPELKQWYRDDQIRNLSEGTDVSKTVSSATRPPGSYTLKWDGKDNEGKPVKAGKYTVVVEGAREHGGYQIERHELNFNAQPQQATLPAGKELGAIKLDYRKR